MSQKNSIKVMLINSMNIWSGGEVHVFLLCQQLKSIGVDVVLACRNGSPMDKNAREANIPVINLPLKNTLDVQSAWKLANYCRKNAIDIIHAHNGRDYWMACLAKTFNPNLKVVLTRHIIVPFKNDLLHRWLYKKVDKVIAVSLAVKEVITTFPQEKVTVIYNGINFKKFAAALPGKLRKELGLSAATKIVGMVGRVHPSKGHASFFQSIPQILSKHPDTAFIVVGGNDISSLKEMNPKVHFLGKRGDVPEIMKDLDILVMASIKEPFGLVTVEAMAAGAAVVGTNSGGTLEIINDGENGLLFPAGDPEKLAEAVIKVLSDDELAGKLKESGLNTAKRFNIEDMVVNTRKVYEEVVEKA